MSRVLLATAMLLVLISRPAWAADAATAPATGAATSAVTAGAQLFEQRCGLCHRGSGPGVFMLERRLGSDRPILEKRTDLAADYVRTIARVGIGSMPRFTRGEITDDELAAIAAYLTAAKAPANQSSK